eukprot:Opistho-2@80552
MLLRRASIPACAGWGSVTSARQQGVCRRRGYSKHSDSADIEGSFGRPPPEGHYEQGSVPNVPGCARQYFYYLDHHGQLFLQDAKIKNFVTCFKEKKFLDFFFKRVRPNTTGRFDADFPWISKCGNELNYMSVNDTPIVYHTLTEDDRLVYGGTLSVGFDPQALSMSAVGRIYHPSPLGGRALLRSAVAVELGRSIVFRDDGVCTLQHRGRDYTLHVDDS